MTPTSTPSDPPQNRTARLAQGAAWMYGRMLLTNVINVGVMAILARRLVPADFGLVALSYSILQLLTLLATEGVNQYIIHDRKPGWEERVQAAFWLDVSMSLLCMTVGLALLPLITHFFDEPGLGQVLLAMLLFFPVKAIAKVPDALLRKRLEFKAIELRDSILELLTAVTSVTLALLDFGVWSIVLPGLGNSVIRAVVVYRITPWRPRLTPHFHLWRPILRYYWNIIGSGLTSYAITDGDTVTIGKVLGSTSLGIYNLGWQVANLVNRTIVGLGNKLALPALASVSHDQSLAFSVLARILRTTSILSFPAFVGLWVVADDFILAVYGPQWEGAILPARILMVFTLRHALAPPIGAFFQAVGKPEVNFRLGLAILPFYLVGVWVGARWGIVGVATGVTVVRTVFGLVGFEVVARFLKMRFRDVLAPLASPMGAALAMGLAVFAVKVPMQALLGRGHLLGLLVQVLVGAAAYVLLLRAPFNTLAREMGAITRPLLGKRQRIVDALLKTA